MLRRMAGWSPGVPAASIVELQRILQGLADGGRDLLVHVLHKAAEPLEVVPDGPVEFGGAVPDHAVVRHALVELLGQLQRRFQPGGSLGHAGALDLERLDLVCQRQGLQEQELNGQLLGLAGGVLQVLAEVGHHGRLGVRDAPFQAVEQLGGGLRRSRSGCGRPGPTASPAGRARAQTRPRPRSPGRYRGRGAWQFWGSGSCVQIYRVKLGVRSKAPDRGARLVLPTSPPLPASGRK